MKTETPLTHKYLYKKSPKQYIISLLHFSEIDSELFCSLSWKIKNHREQFRAIYASLFTDRVKFTYHDQ